MSPWKTGWDRMPFPMVLVRCRHCHRWVSLYHADAHGDGYWKRPEREPCTCDPPPVLPQGGELDRLVRRARRIRRRGPTTPPGRAPVVVSR